MALLIILDDIPGRRRVDLSASAALWTRSDPPASPKIFKDTVGPRWRRRQRRRWRRRHRRRRRRRRRRRCAPGALRNVCVSLSVFLPPFLFFSAFSLSSFLLLASYRSAQPKEGSLNLIRALWSLPRCDGGRRLRESELGLRFFSSSLRLPSLFPPGSASSSTAIKFLLN